MWHLVFGGMTKSWRDEGASKAAEYFLMIGMKKKHNEQEKKADKHEIVKNEEMERN